MFAGLPDKNVCWMSHNDYIETAAPGFEIVAHTPNCPVAAAQDKPRGLYCVQFHPEVLPTETITTAANRIVNEVKNINRVMFDYTTKPPATIEWE